MVKGKLEEMRRKVFLLVVCGLFAVVHPSLAEQEESSVSKRLSQKLNAYVQVRYTNGEPGADGFRIRRARFGFKGELLKDFSIKFQVDGTRSPILLDAAVEISSIPYATLLFGQFKVPFSLENLSSSSALDLVNRSQTVKELCPAQDIGSAGRDIGVTVSGEFSILEYNLGVFNGSGMNRVDTNEQKDIVGRLRIHPFDFLVIGVSQYMGDQRPLASAVSVNRDRTGVDVFFSKEPVFLKGEYIFARDDQDERSGWYVRGGYSFIPDKLQAIVNYDSYDQDLDLAGNRIEVITLGVNWFFSQKTKLQVNYEHHSDEFSGITDNVFLAQFQAFFEK